MIDSSNHDLMLCIGCERETPSELLELLVDKTIYAQDGAGRRVAVARKRAGLDA